MTFIVSTGTGSQTSRRYLRPPSPLFFPSEELVPETSVHLWLTPEEAERAERIALESERAAKEAALARVAELERQLRQKT